MEGSFCWHWVQAFFLINIRLFICNRPMITCEDEELVADDKEGNFRATINWTVCH